MVLIELGTSLTNALGKMRQSRRMNQEVVNEMIKDICNALFIADCPFPLVAALKQKWSSQLNVDGMPAGSNKKMVVEKVIYDELLSLLKVEKQPFSPSRKKRNVFLFVGLQGAGKTTTLSKVAHYYRQRRWKTAMVCADTFRAGAFDQLSQNAKKMKVPFYGSYSEPDPIQVAKRGVQLFQEEGFEIILVDTSGRHKQEEALFEEMKQLSLAIHPDCIVFVMDGSIGQAALAQATAFQSAVNVGAVILTKMDGHGKGGGALCAVSATKSPILFVGTGEHMEDLEMFDPSSFVSRWMGRGDVSGLSRILSESMDVNQQQYLTQRVMEGHWTFRDMQQQYQMLSNMGSFQTMLSMIPGTQGMFSGLQEKEGEMKKQMKCSNVMMDSMTELEMDNPTLLLKHKSASSRILRIAKGSGHTVKEVTEMIISFQQFAIQLKKMKGMNLSSLPLMNKKNRK